LLICGRSLGFESAEFRITKHLPPVVLRQLTESSQASPH
jgi:hypothetical protein